MTFSSLHKPVSKPAPVRTGLLQRKCACGGAKSPSGECSDCRRKKKLGLQTKLRVNRPGDRYEREADRVAEQVMRMPDRAPPPVAPPPLIVPPPPPCLGRFLPAGSVQRQAEEKPKKPKEENEETNGVPPPNASAGLEAPRSGGRPLDADMRSFFEPRFGHDFGKVRIHTDARAAHDAQAVHARAFALGGDLVFGAGQYRPETSAGRHLLAHELVHTIQQGASPETAPPGGSSAAAKSPAAPVRESRLPRIQTTRLSPRIQRANTPDGVNLGPTDNTKSFCLKPRTFHATTSVDRNTATGARGRQEIRFEGLNTGRQDGKNCDCGCGLYRHWVRGYWRSGSATAAKKHNVTSCGNALNMSENAWTEEHTSCIGDNDADACKWSYGDFPGWRSGLADGMYVELHYGFKYQIWDHCRNRSIAQAIRTLDISGDTAPRTITWSR